LICNLEETLNLDIKSISNQQLTKTSTLNNNKLDKASILRETAQYLRKHQNGIILYEFLVENEEFY